MRSEQNWASLSLYQMGLQYSDIHVIIGNEVPGTNLISACTWLKVKKQLSVPILLVVLAINMESAVSKDFKLSKTTSNRTDHRDCQIISDDI